MEYPPPENDIRYGFIRKYYPKLEIPHINYLWSKISPRKIDSSVEFPVRRVFSGGKCALNSGRSSVVHIYIYIYVCNFDESLCIKMQGKIRIS